MGKKFKACFSLSPQPSKCLVLEASFLDAIVAVEPQEEAKNLVLLVLSDSTLLVGVDVTMRFSLIASNFAGRAMDLLVKDGCPHGEAHTKIQGLFQGLCCGWTTQESFEHEKGEFTNLIKTWLVEEKRIDNHSRMRPGPDYRHPLGMFALAIDLCFSSDLPKQIHGVQKYLEAIGYLEDRIIAERELAENSVIGCVYDLFEPELGDCFGRKEE